MSTHGCSYQKLLDIVSFLFCLVFPLSHVFVVPFIPEVKYLSCERSYTCMWKSVKNDSRKELCVYQKHQQLDRVCYIAVFWTETIKNQNAGSGCITLLWNTSEKDPSITLAPSLCPAEHQCPDLEAGVLVGPVPTDAGRSGAQPSPRKPSLPSQHQQHEQGTDCSPRTRVRSSGILIGDSLSLVPGLHCVSKAWGEYWLWRNNSCMPQWLNFL